MRLLGPMSVAGALVDNFSDSGDGECSACVSRLSSTHDQSKNAKSENRTFANLYAIVDGNFENIKVLHTFDTFLGYPLPHPGELCTVCQVREYAKKVRHILPEIGLL